MQPFYKEYQLRTCLIIWICKYNQYAFNWNLDNILKESIAQRKGCQRVIDWHSQEGNITVETIHRTFDIP